METILMTFVNKDGKMIEKEIEPKLVSIYKSMGWVIKSDKKEEITIKYEKPEKVEKKYDSFSSLKIQNEK